MAAVVAATAGVDRAAASSGRDPVGMESACRGHNRLSVDMAVSTFGSGLVRYPFVCTHCHRELEFSLARSGLTPRVLSASPALLLVQLPRSRPPHHWHHRPGADCWSEWGARCVELARRHCWCLPGRALGPPPTLARVDRCEAVVAVAVLGAMAMTLDEAEASSGRRLK